MKQLKNSKKAESSAKTMRGTLANAGTTIAGHTTGGDGAGNMLLLSGLKKGQLGALASSSLGNTMSSNDSSANQVLPLKYVLKNAELIKFEIGNPAEKDKLPINKKEDTGKKNAGL